MLIPEPYFTTAVGDGTIKKEHEIVERTCTFCHCDYYWTKGAWAYQQVTKATCKE